MERKMMTRPCIQDRQNQMGLPNMVRIVDNVCCLLQRIWTDTCGCHFVVSEKKTGAQTGKNKKQKTSAYSATESSGEQTKSTKGMSTQTDLRATMICFDEII
jgi:hypothetical protein